MIPLAYALCALIAGLAFAPLEDSILPGFVSPMSLSAAMAMYSAVASGMIALTGIVFSLMFVMIQFSATAYSPRLVLWVSQDPVMSHSLGVFTATFLYAISALANVDRGGSGRVPRLSVLVVVILLAASVAMFVVLINRIGRLKVTNMLVFTADQGRRVIENLYPVRNSAPSEADPEAKLEGQTPVQTLVHHGRPAAVQAVRLAPLVSLAKEHDCILQFVAAVGDTVAEPTTILRAYGPTPIDERKLRREIMLGMERTFEQDPKYAIRLVVDIAIKALSPAINDPTTAVQALDQLEDLLVRLGRSPLHAGTFRDEERNPRVILPLPEWEDFLLLAFDEIRYCGAQSIQVMRRMSALISDLILSLPEHRRPALEHWQSRLQATISRAFQDDEEKHDAAMEDRQGLGVPRRKPR